MNSNVGESFDTSSSSTIMVDREAPSGKRWTVPVGLGASQVLKIGPLPVRPALSASYNDEKPKVAADSQLQFQFALLFPR